MRRLILLAMLLVVVGTVGAAGADVHPETLPLLGGGDGVRRPITAETFFQLIIPEIDVNVAVYQAWVHRRTWEFRVFTEEAGHLQYTAYPGEGGNVVIGAHYELADFEPGPFYRLDELEIGDRIQVYFMGMPYTYEVVATDLVDPHDLSILQPTPFEVLTLLTCYDYSPNAATYTQRYIVRAVRVDGP